MTYLQYKGGLGGALDGPTTAVWPREVDKSVEPSTE